MHHLPAVWLWLATALTLHLILAFAASGHAVLSKRDTRAAVGWVGVICLTPVVGVLLYIWLGINRIQRRAQSLRAERPRLPSTSATDDCPEDILQETLTQEGGHLEHLINLVHDVTRRPLLRGNRVMPLVNGDCAYPAMLQAIDEAAQSITLTTYIFRNDAMGNMFLNALRRAVARQVEVRVLIDDVGARYSWRSMPRVLKRAGIPCAQFLPTLIPWRFRYSNLRSHRKIMVVDGRVGFTGGINVDERNCLARRLPRSVRDLHFRLTGPVVVQLQEVFADDWAFCTSEVLQGELWFPSTESEGAVLARGISDGPDDHFETLRLTFLGAIACARTSVLVVTPYFLPDASLIAALNVAALRGVEVDVVLPAKNDLVLVQWASMSLLRQLMERGCRVWLVPPPFDHTKLMLVDGIWTLLGSANWDPRSLRLNFEFNVECYNRELTSSLTDLVRLKMQQSQLLNLADVDARSLPVKLRDGIAGLFSPYL